MHCVQLFQINHLVNYQKFEKFLKSFTSEFSHVDIWFTDQNSKPLKIDDKANLELVANWCLTCKIRYSIKSKDEIC